MDLLPDDLGRFLDANIESIDQLEILRVLAEDPARVWSAVALAVAAQADPAAVAGHLARMHDRGLLAVEARGCEPLTRYGPATPAVAALLGQLLQLYKERPVSLIKLVYARAADPLRTFADTFRFRPPEGR